MWLKKIRTIFPLFLLFSLIFAQPSYAVFGVGDCINSESICVTGWNDSNNPTPGSDCINNTSYKFGSTDTCWGKKSPCVPSCGFLGNGYCCDPKVQGQATPTPTPFPVPPTPPCAQTVNKTNQDQGCGSVDTAIGKINTNVGDLTNTIFRILLSLSGGIAVLLIIASGYQLMTSQGNPEKVKEARERLTSAIVGLLFIIFSIALLQIIGVDILHIPGFSR